jgi:hypothetical protein
MSKLKIAPLQANPYGFFTVPRGSIRAVDPGGAMDIWFIGLMLVLTLLTWGGVLLCGQLLRQP